MPRYCVPLDNPSPDADHFIRCILGREVAGRPPTIEYMVDSVVMRLIVTDLLGREWVVPDHDDRESLAAYWDNVIQFWYRMGYDFVMMELALPFPKHQMLAPDTASQSDGDRTWADEHQGAISSWEDFEVYDWPTLKEADFFPYEYVSAHLPDGMGLMASHSGGVFEHLTWIMSYERLCYALYDDLKLVEAVVEKLGTLMEGYFARLLEVENLIALWPGDDMGFRTATLINPEHLRQYILPWHSRFAEMAHRRGIAYLLHSCGNIEAIMADLIEDVGIDGKHSFEDVIIPAPEFHRRYGDRIATLGGVDVHLLSSAEPDELRRYVRDLIEACAPIGRFAVGSGNSIPGYVPVDNYLTMLDEALR